METVERPESFAIGASLRQARRRAGVGLDEVEQATRIPARFLTALEDERFERLPQGLYRHSFLREYAEFLGLDGDLFVAEYDAAHAPPEPDPPPPRRESALARALRPGRVALLLLAAVVGIGVWRLGRTPGPSAVTTTPAVAPAAPRHETHTTMAVRSAPPALRLTAARGDCWLLVQAGSSSGPVVYERTLHAGETIRFGLRRPLWIRLGAPWNVDASIGSRSVTPSLPSAPGDVLARGSGLRPAS